MLAAVPAVVDAAAGGAEPRGACAFTTASAPAVQARLATSNPLPTKRLLADNHRLPKAQFLRTVRTGRDAKGMPEWASLLNTKQMNDLFVYVRARADKVLPPGRPDEVGPPRGKPWAPPAGWVAK